MCSIWSRGDIVLKSLKEQLTKACVHSLCDFVCEFYAFTAPLCQPPDELFDDMASVSAHEDHLFMANNKGECRLWSLG